MQLTKSDAVRFATSCLVAVVCGRPASAQTTFSEPTITPQSQSSGEAGAPTGQQTDLFTGRFTYSIPIRVAPSRAGSEPSVSIGYSSSGSNSWCGVGWDLSVGCVERDGKNGVPIARTPSGYSKAYDDAAGFVSSFGPAASRLLQAETLNTFRPEADRAFFKFTRDVAQNQWLVTDPSGTRYIFGAVDGTVDAALRNPKSGWTTGWDATYRWCLKKIVDTNGNETWFDYVFDELLTGPNVHRQQYLAQIRYGGSSVGPLPPTHTVSFGLAESAPGQLLVRPDAFSSLRTGWKVLTRRRLASVEVRVGAALVRRYELAYEISPSTRKSLLSTVQEIGRDGISSLPPLTFEYDQMSMAFGPRETWGGIHNQSNPNDPDWNSLRAYGHGSACGSQGLSLRDIRDMDKDGRPDLIMLPCGESYDHLNVQYNNGSGFEPGVRPVAIYTPNVAEKYWASPRFDDSSSSGSQVIGRFQRIDFDGDGYDDALWRVAGATGGQFHARLSRRGIEFPYDWFNLNLSYGNQGQSSGVWNSPEATANVSSNGDFPDLETSLRVAAFLDMNGDGRPDFVQRKASGADLRFWKVQLNTGTGLEGARDWSLASQGNTGGAWNSIAYSYSYVPTDGDASYHAWHPQSANIPNTYTWTTIGTVLVSNQFGPITNVNYSDFFWSNGNFIELRLVHPDGTQHSIFSGFNIDTFDGKNPSGTWSLQARDLSPNVTTLARVDSWTLDIEFAEHDRGHNAGIVSLADMNGDGLLDRVSAELNTNSAPGGSNQYDAFAVELNNGAGLEPAEYWSIQSQGLTQRWWTSPGGEKKYDSDDDEDENLHCATLTDLRDMNGDGLPDKVQRAKVAPYDRLIVQLNTGSGFAPELSFDGVLFPDNPSSYAWYWGAPSGQRGFETRRTSHDLVDMDGDGLVDRVMERNASAYDRLYVQRSLGKVPDLLSQIDNGVGGKTTVEYTPSSRFDNRETIGTANPWSEGTSGAKNLLPGLYQLVTRVTVDDGMGQALSTTYDYAGGFFDTARREFRGFYKVTRVDPDLTRTVTRFHQGGGPVGEKIVSSGPVVTPASLGEYGDVSIPPNFPGAFSKAGLAFQVEIFGREADGTERLYKRTYHKVVADSMGGGRYFPHVDQTTTYDIDGLPSQSNHKAVVRRFIYEPTPDGLVRRLTREEDYGQIVPAYFDPPSHAFGESGLVPDNLSRVTVYASAADLGNPDILDRVKERRLHANVSGAGTPIRLTRNVFFAGSGRLKEAWRASDIAGGVWVTESFTYDEYGNQQTRTDGVGIVSQSDYDPVHHTHVVQTIADVNGFHRVTQLVVDPLSGHVTESIDPNGLRTLKRFDAFFRPTETAIDAGGGEVWQERVAYHLGGIAVGPQSHNYTLRRTNQGLPSDPDGSAVYEYQDGQGRSIQTRAESEDVAGRFRVTDTLYDARGNPFRRTTAYFGSGSAYDAPPPAQAATEQQFDALGRVKRIVRPAGEVGAPLGDSTIAYSDFGGLWTTVTTDPEGEVRKTRGDAHGRTIAVVDEGNFTTLYFWNLAGDLEQLHDAKGNVTTIVYDALGQKRQMIDPDMGSWTYLHDPAGRLVEQTDALGNRTVNHHDGLGRVYEKQVFAVGGALQSTILSSYDAPVESGYTVNLGQLARIIDVEGTTLFSYDARGRVTRETRRLNKLPGREFTFRYEYDDAGHVRFMTYPDDALTLEYIRDDIGTLRTVRSAGGAAGSVVFYQASAVNEAGQVLSFSYGNGVDTTLSYYPASKQLRRIQATGPQGLVQDLEYTYDKVGNVKSVADLKFPAAPESSSLSDIQYDDFHRLVRYTRSGAAPGSTQTVVFSYDEIGNLIINGDLDGAAGAQPYLYQSPLGQPHAVTQANGTSFGYDANGNMVQRGTQVLEYDAQNHLSKLTRPSGSITFGYDAGGKRLWKAVGSAKFTLWMKGVYEEREGKRLCHVMADDRRVCTFMPGSLKPVDSAPLEGIDPVPVNVFHFNHSDQLRSASVVTNLSGGVIQHYVFRAFGFKNHEQTDGSFGPGYLFTDQVFDAETGLYDFGARFYDPLIGRFVQADPIVPEAGHSQSLNRYAYAENNPLRFNDATGHAPQDNFWQYFVMAASHGIRAALRTLAPVDVQTRAPLTRIDLFSGNAYHNNPEWFATHQTIRNTVYGQIGNAADIAYGPNTPEANAVWARQSRTLATRGALAQVPTQSNYDMPTEFRATTIQSRVERPALLKAGSFVSGLGVLSGGYQMYASSDYSPGLRELGFTAGAAEAGGSLSYFAGSWFAKAGLMSSGSALMTLGGGAAAVVNTAQLSVDLSVGMGMFAEKLYEPIHRELDRINSFGQPAPAGLAPENVWYITPPWVELSPWEMWSQGYPLDQIPPPKSW